MGADLISWCGRICAMPSAVSLRTDFSAGELRRLAVWTKHVNQSRRLLSLAAVLDGMSRAEAARIGGPDRAVHGVVRWRRVDLQRLLAERFGVIYHERTVGKILHKLGFSHISARPRHPAQDERIVAEFKKLLGHAE